MRTRSASLVLQDLIGKRSCQEIHVQYSCGHREEAQVTLPTGLQEKDKRLNGRSALKMLRAQCRRGDRSGAEPHDTNPSFWVEVPVSRCRECMRRGYSAEEAGERQHLRCGSVAMDVPCPKDSSEDTGPIGISARQLLEWVQMPQAAQPYRVSLAAARDPLENDRAGALLDGIREATGCAPILIAIASWVVGCAAYAVHNVPGLQMVTPDLFHDQLQQRIESIPVPLDTPQYSQYKQYYMRQYTQYVQEYSIQKAQWERNRPLFNLQVFLHGLGVGVLVFAALLAYCEYHWGTISYWMELAEDLWSVWQERREKSRDPMADSAKMENFLKEMGEEQLQATASTAPVKSAAKKEKKKVERCEAPAPACKSEAQAALESSMPPAPAVPTPTAAKCLKCPSPDAKAAPMAATVSSKVVVEPACSTDVAAPKAGSTSVVEPLPSGPKDDGLTSLGRPVPPLAMAQPPPSPKKEQVTQSQAEDKSLPRSCTMVPPAAWTLPSATREEPQASIPVAASRAAGGASCNVRERLRQKVYERHRQQFESLVTQVVAQAQDEYAEAGAEVHAASIACRQAEEESCKPTIKEEASTKGYAELLREAEELLSQFEGESLCRQLEEEKKGSEKAKRKKAKRKSSDKTGPNEMRSEDPPAPNEETTHHEGHAATLQEVSEAEGEEAPDSDPAAAFEASSLDGGSVDSTSEGTPVSVLTDSSTVVGLPVAQVNSEEAENEDAQTTASEEPSVASSHQATCSGNDSVDSIQDPELVLGQVSAEPCQSPTNDVASGSAGTAASPPTRQVWADMTDDSEAESDSDDKGIPKESTPATPTGPSTKDELGTLHEEHRPTAEPPRAAKSQETNHRGTKPTYDGGRQERSRGKTRRGSFSSKESKRDHEGRNSFRSSVENGDLNRSSSYSDTKGSYKEKQPRSPAAQQADFLQWETPKSARSGRGRGSVERAMDASENQDVQEVRSARGTGSGQRSGATKAPTTPSSVAKRAVPRSWAEAVSSPTENAAMETTDSSTGALVSAMLDELRSSSVEQILDWFRENGQSDWLQKHRKDGLQRSKVCAGMRSESKQELLSLAAALLRDQLQGETQVDKQQSAQDGGTPKANDPAQRRWDALSPEHGAAAGACILSALGCNGAVVAEEETAMGAEPHAGAQPHVTMTCKEVGPANNVSAHTLRADAPEFVPTETTTARAAPQPVMPPPAMQATMFAVAGAPQMVPVQVVLMAQGPNGPVPLPAEHMQAMHIVAAPVPADMMVACGSPTGSDLQGMPVMPLSGTPAPQCTGDDLQTSNPDCEASGLSLEQKMSMLRALTQRPSIQEIGDDEA